MFPDPKRRNSHHYVSEKKSEEAARNTLLSPSAHVGGCIGWDPADMLYYGRRERGPPSCVDGA